MKLLPLAAVAALFASAAHAQAPAPPGLDIRFCPAGVARPYPLDTLHDVQSLLIQNVAVINRGPAPAEVEAVEEGCEARAGLHRRADRRRGGERTVGGGGVR